MDITTFATLTDNYKYKNIVTFKEGFYEVLINEII